ncbi:MAG TPA: DUF6285 domain-containing protein [Solirubrobacteraceae bacterium]|nr:DUF6285 domain-containing protein [Solirubrobacteraceae bacterium]
MQDRPEAWELLAALRMFLADDVAPAVPGELRFGMRVAINVCAMLEREARLGESSARDEIAALAALLPSTAGGRADASGDARETARALQRDLAASIRGGDLDDRLDEVVGVMRERLAARLRVAHPGWESFRDGR